MGSPPPALVGLELVVADLDVAAELFVSALGFEDLGRSRHGLHDADVAFVGNGEIVVSLLQPTATGDGEPVADPRPRVGQLVLGVGAADIEDARSRAVASGAVVRDDAADGSFHLGMQTVEGALGGGPAMAFRVIDEPPSQHARTSSPG